MNSTCFPFATQGTPIRGRPEFVGLLFETDRLRTIGETSMALSQAILFAAIRSIHLELIPIDFCRQKFEIKPVPDRDTI